MNKESIQRIIETSDKLRTLNSQKLRAKERFQSNSILGYEGGLFKVDTDLLVYVNYLLQQGKGSDTVIIDSNENPILIKSVKDFNNAIQDKYFTAIDIYYNDIKELELLKKSTARYLDLEI